MNVALRLPEAGLSCSGYCATEGRVRSGNQASGTSANGWHQLCRKSTCPCPHHDHANNSHPFVKSPGQAWRICALCGGAREDAVHDGFPDEAEPTNPTQGEVEAMSEPPSIHTRPGGASKAAARNRAKVNENAEKLAQVKANQSASPPEKKTPAKSAEQRTRMQFLVDGSPVIEVHSRLSGISRATAKKGGERLSTEQLRALLVKNGIADPDNEPFSFTLPNGIVIESRVATEADKAAWAAGPKARSAAKKTTAAQSTSERVKAEKAAAAAKRAPAKKAPAEKKAPAKKAAPASKEVTPITKNAGRKAS